MVWVGLTLVPGPGSAAGTRAQAGRAERVEPRAGRYAGPGDGDGVCHRD